MIELRAITKRFRGLTALDEVGLQLEAEEVLGLIGPNGSGKTTLLGITSGVLRPTSGDVVIDGSKATGFGPAATARLGVGRTFQQVRLFEDMSVAETVAVGAIAKGVDDEAIDSLLSTLGLAEHCNRDASTLAYGLQRRVEIARALAGRPRYLLLDEPAAGMNEGETQDLLTTMSRVPAQLGCGILIVDHDLRLIMEMCDRIQVLNEGRTLAEGSPAEIRRSQVVIDAYIGTPEAPRTESARG